MAHGGQLLADMLVHHGVKRVFSVPGESFLAALDGLYENGVPNIVCRHEGAAAMMAEAHGKMHGTPGVCFVTRGPGATNASAGVHIAMQDSSPMILFVGQIARGDRDREVFQEVDYRAMFGPLAKWVAEIDQTDRIPEYIARAFHVATSGRPGPVVLALPEDMLSSEVEAKPLPPISRVLTPDLSGNLAEVMDWLSQAERPLVVIGGPHWSAQAAADLATFAAKQNLPVACSFRRQDYLDNRHPSYVGDLNVAMNPKLAQRVKTADRILLLGTRFSDIETQGFALMDPTAPTARFAHVHADANETGHIWHPDLALHCTAPEAVAALAKLPACGTDWNDWTSSARKDFEAWITPAETPGDLKLEQVIHWLSNNLPEDAILTNGAGNYAAFLHRYYVFKSYRTQLAPTSGSMGYGYPASVSASLEYPDKTVVCLAGDGCFQMTLNEMSTAAQYGATPIVVVVNNGRYGTIRMHQEKHYPARVSGTELANPDFAALARAYGGHGETVTKTADFGAAFERAKASGKLAVIEVVTDPEMLTTGKTLTQVRTGT